MPLFTKLLPLLCLFATTAAAQTYDYTARTAQPVLRSGAVQAGSLTWQCSGTSCTISGPWARPGVGACANLAGVVGRIVEYGHPGSKLDADQLIQCNQGPPTPQVRLNPNIARQVRPKPLLREAPKPRLPGRRHVPVAPADGEGGATTSDGDLQLGLEEAGYGDFTLYVKTTEGVRFHGTYTGAHPTPPAPRVRWSGTTLRLPALRHTGTDDPEERTVSAGRSPADTVVETSVSGRTLELPLQLAKIPQRVASVDVKCAASVVAAGTGVFTEGSFSEQNTIGFAEGTFWRRPTTAGDWSLSTTARLPLNLRPYMTPQDIHSVACSLHLAVARTNGTGVDNVSLEVAADRDSRHFVPGLAAAGPSTIEVQADLED